MGKQKYYDINNRVKRLYLFTLRPYTIPVLVLVLLLTGLMVFNSSLTRKHALAASYTWDGGGSTNNWSECANWSTDICPTSADSVVFNNTSTKDSTVDASFGGVVATVGINAGYTGTISLARSLQTTSTFSQGAGSFVAANHVLDVDTSFTLSAGTFTAPSTTMFVGRIFTVSGTPTFNNNGGTVTFDGSTSDNITCNNITFNLVTISHTAGTKTINSSCSLPLGNNPTITGVVTLNGTLTGSGTMTTNGAYTRNTGSTVTGFTGIIANANYTIAGATVDQSNFTTADYNATFTMSSGAFTAPSGTMTVASTFTISGGIFNANGGTLTFDGTTSPTLSCNNATFNLVIFAQTAGTKTVSSNCTFPLGNNPTIGAGGSGQGLTLNGTLTGTGTLTTASTLSYTRNAGSVVTGFTGIVANSTYTINGATVDQSTYTTADYNGAFVLSSGSFTAPSGTMTVASTFTISGGTFNANGGTIEFDGTTSATLSCNNATFNLVVFAHTGGTKTVSSNCNMPLGTNPTKTTGGGITLNGTLSGSGTLTFTVAGISMNSATAALSGFTGLVLGGTFTNNLATLDLSTYTTVDFNGAFVLNSGQVIAPTGSMTVASSFNIAGGTFTGGTGTLAFDGTTTATITCTGTAVFNIVTFAHTSSTKIISSNCNLPMGSNPVTTSNGSLTLNGTLSGSGTLTISNGNLTMNSATATLSGFTGLVMGGSFTNLLATLDLSTYTIVDFNGNTALSSGTVTAPSITMTFADNLILGPDVTFNANGGTVELDGAADSTLTCSDKSFNQVNIVHTSGTKSIRADCSLPLGTNPTIGAGGNIINDGTLSGTGTLSADSPTLILGLNSNLSGFSGLITQNLVIQDITANFSSFTTFDVNGSFSILKPASFTAPSDQLSISGDISTPSSSDSYLYMPGAAGNYVTSPDSSALDITGDIDLRIRLSMDDWTPSAVRRLMLKRSIGGTGESYGLNASTDGSLQLVLSTDGTTIPQATSSIPTGFTNGTEEWVRVTWQASDGRVQFFTADGTLANPSGGDWTQLGTDQTIAIPSIADTTTPLSIASTSTGTAGTVGGKVYRAQVYNGIDGTLVFDADFTAQPDGTTSFAESANEATVTLNGSDLRIVGPGSGTFHPNSGTVILDGSSQTLGGALTFYNLTKTVSSASTLTLPASTTTTIQNNLTLSGATGQLLSLVSSSPSTQWRIDVNGSDNLNYLDVADSYNQGSLLTACYSTDSGNNFNWSIKPGTCTTSAGGGGDTGGDTGTDTGTGSGTSSGTDSSPGSGSPLIPKDDNPPDELTPPNSFLDSFRKKVTGSEKTDWNYKKIIAYGLGILVLLWILILVVVRLLRGRELSYFRHQA